MGSKIIPKCAWALALGALVVPLSRAAAGDTAGTLQWSQFRGPDRSGVSAETGLAREWPEDGPPVVWRREIGEGYSGAAFSDGHFFTLFAVGDEEFLGSFRAADGEEIWRRKMGETFSDQFGRGPRSTPTVDGGVVYALGGKGLLLAAKAQTGEPIWSKELTVHHGFAGPEQNPGGPPPGVVRVPAFGYATSPLVEGDLLIFEAGTAGKSYVALDKATGEVRWTALEEPGITYSSPGAVTIGGVRHILALRPSELVALSPEGEVYWRHPWSMTVSQPVVVPPDGIFLSTTEIAAGQGVPGATFLRVGLDSGKPTVEEVWASRIMRNYSAASVLWEGSLYGFDNATLRCITAASGEPCWARRGLGRGSLMAADGLLFVWSDQGRLILIEATPEEYRELGRVQIFEDGRTWTPPVLADGHLYLRGNTEMVSLDVRRPSNGE